MEWYPGTCILLLVMCWRLHVVNSDQDWTLQIQRPAGDFYMDTTEYCSSDGSIHVIELNNQKDVIIHGKHEASRVPSFPPLACLLQFHTEQSQLFKIQVEGLSIRTCDIVLSVIQKSPVTDGTDVIREYTCSNYTDEILYGYGTDLVLKLDKNNTRSSQYSLKIMIQVLDPGTSTSSAISVKTQIHVLGFVTFLPVVLSTLSSIWMLYHKETVT